MDVKRRIVSSILLTVVLAPAAVGQIRTNDRPVAQHDKRYLDYVRQCLDLLIEHGTDRYGKTKSPILVSILDVRTRDCPENPEQLDEEWRVIRRGRRNPAGANLLTDQPLLKTMYALSAVTGDAKYAAFARTYSDYYMKNLVDEKGLFWWGWHRHYDVFKDTMSGHDGNPHEIHATNGIHWEGLWDADPKAVLRVRRRCGVSTVRPVGTRPRSEKLGRSAVQASHYRGQGEQTDGPGQPVVACHWNSRLLNSRGRVVRVPRSGGGVELEEPCRFGRLLLQNNVVQ